MLKDWSGHYRRAHLRENPFQELSAEILYEIFPLPDELVQILRQEPPWTLQILGPCGSGKTSTLAGIFQHFRVAGSEPFLFTVGREETVIPEEVSPLLLDEAHRLDEQKLREILVSRQGEGMITVTAGDGDLSATIPFSCEIWTVPAPSLQDLQQIFSRRLQYYSIGDGGSTFSLSESAAEEALRLSQGNLRHIRALLYEIFTWEPIPAVIEAGHVTEAHACISLNCDTDTQ
ncbi:MAG: hypothetical protein AB2L14_27595 [Candidatus Xenobiia bacterium LiM19]